MEEDFYKILGVAKDADDATIKKAYRQIARENHPDLNPDDKVREDRFKSASAAFEVLSDPERRKLYDEFGSVGLREGFNAEQAREYKRWQSSGGGRGPGQYQTNANFEDLFGNIFGGRSPFDTSDYSNFGGFYTGPMKGQDIEATLDLDFMTAVQGGELELSLGGRKIKVRIPAGADDGERLRLKGQGQPAPAQAPKGTAGDLILSLRVAPHPHLHRDGLDLLLDFPVTMPEAITGAKLEVPTPHGGFNVSIPPGVNSGAKLRLREKGVHRGKKKGDFYVVIQIQAPDEITDETKALAEKLTEAYSRDVRADLEL
ncbi:MAG: DnaJ C-terminal domain-containing protein [bacterium]